MVAIFHERFNGLQDQAREIIASQSPKKDTLSELTYMDVDENLLLGWSIKVRHLLASLCGRDSEYYSEFIKLCEPSAYVRNITRLLSMNAVFEAAKDDFEGGYLTTVRKLVQADVFANEIEQARELLKANYPAAAAVICGTVLETSLRDMCISHGLTTGKLNKMNDDLVKAGQYNSLVNKRIAWMAGVRNSAAHGEHDKYSCADVASMIDDAERYLSEWLK